MTRADPTPALALALVGALGGVRSDVGESGLGTVDGATDVDGTTVVGDACEAADATGWLEAAGVVLVVPVPVLAAAEPTAACLFLLPLLPDRDRLPVPVAEAVALVELVLVRALDAAVVGLVAM